ncbi:MAG: TIM barrel protein [bacterium]|jgi:sugar phosphate isomerase/epimerase|nr:sugar phosphate isomerase/epimerase [candidate division KSB1 bacterium]MDH7560196.1 TIM barrel protein [bacterium]
MLGLSTAWIATKVDNGDRLLDALRETGLSALELDYRVTATMLQQMRRRLRSHEFRVLSVHNYCPLPEGVPQHQACGDLFRLSSTDAEERAQAVKLSLKSVHLAADLEARAVVFHLGEVVIDNPDNDMRLRQFYEEKLVDSEEAEAYRAQKKAERLAKRQPYLDAVLLSLDRIHAEAVRLGVYLGVENRFYLHQIPDLEEVGIILNEFRGGNIGYWHDCGHAHVQACLRVTPHEAWLEREGAHLLGVHLHDARGLEDHQAPGTGEIDFDLVAKYLRADTVRVIEVHPTTTVTEIQGAIALLQSKGIAEAT